MDRKILRSHPLPVARNALTVVTVCIVHVCGCAAELRSRSHARRPPTAETESCSN